MKKDYGWNPSKCICENSKYLKSTSVTERDETVMDIVSTKKTVATNVTSLPSINCHNIKVRDCFYKSYVLLLWWYN